MKALPVRFLEERFKDLVKIASEFLGFLFELFVESLVHEGFPEGDLVRGNPCRLVLLERRSFRTSFRSAFSCRVSGSLTFLLEYGRRSWTGLQVRVPPGRGFTDRFTRRGRREMAMVVGASGFLLLRLSVEAGRPARFIRLSPRVGCLFKTLVVVLEVCRESGRGRSHHNSFWKGVTTADTTHPQGPSGGVEASACRWSGGCLDTTGLEARSLWWCEGHTGRVETADTTRRRWCFVSGTVGAQFTGGERCFLTQGPLAEVRARHSGCFLTDSTGGF